MELMRCTSATEYAYVANRLISRITAMGVEDLHAPSAAFTKYQERNTVLEDLVAMSRIADETAQIAEIDRQQDELLVYILQMIRSAKNMQLLHSSVGLCRIVERLTCRLLSCKGPQRQQVQKVQGLLTDLAKPELAKHVQTLGLTSEVEELAHTAE
jgi:hypothetical protein